MPPMPKYRTIKMTLKSPVDIPKEFAIPESTPPSILSFKFLVIWGLFLESQNTSFFLLVLCLRLVIYCGGGKSYWAN